MKKSNFYEYGPFRLDPAEHRLTRDGIPVSLAPKAFELLIFLVQNPGRLLSKEQIMQTLWPGSFVEDANLTVSISVLRRVLGEKDGNVRYIETVPKKGYRFIASVKEGYSTDDPLLENDAPVAGVQPASTNHSDAPISLQPAHGETDSSGAPPMFSRTAFLATTAIFVLILLGILVGTGVHLTHRKAAAAPEPLPPTLHSLAVLPLRNLKQNPQDEFLGFSLADAIITRLGPVSSLTVRPSSAVERYKGQTIDPKNVGADLGVDTLLTGTFIHDGDHLRVTYQMIDVKTEKILTKDMIDLEYKNLFAVQDNVAQRIIQGLSLELSPAETVELKGEEPVNPLAYEYYLRGVDLMSNHDFPLAIKMLQKSADLNPNYALTWAYLGQSYNSAASFQVGGEEQYRKAQKAFRRALALQPNQIEASVFLANLLIDTGDVEAAVPLLRAAEKTNSNNAALHWELGYAYRFAGALEESVAECEQALHIDPFVRGNGSVLNAYLYLGRYDKFLASLPEANDSSFLVFYRGFGEFHQRDLTRAAKDFDRAYELERTMYTQTGKALSDSIARRDSEGLELLHDLENKIQQRGVGDPEGTYKIAEAYAILGDKASALRMLRYSIDHGFFAWPYFASDPLLSNVRNEPGFSELMAMSRYKYDKFRKSFL